MGLQLRLWLTVVVLVVAGVLVLLLGTSAMYERVMLPFDSVSSQAMTATEGALIKHGDEAVDAATKASVDDAVRAAVKSGEMSPEAEAALLGRAGNQGAPAVAFLVKPDGSIAGHAGGDVKLEGPLTGFPMFAEASTGLARDGVSMIGGKPFHLASAPVYDGGALVGVVLLGWPYDATFADRLTQTVGAPIVVMVNDQRLGSALAALTPDQLKVRGSGVGDLDLKPLPSILPLLMEHGRYTLAARPLTFGTNEPVSIIVGTDRNEAFKALAWAQAMVIAGTLLITLLQAVLILATLRGVSKPIEVIVDHLSQVSQGNSVGILPEAALSGQFLRLGKQVNMILQMMPSATRPGSLGALGSPALGGGPLGGGPLGGAMGGPALGGPGSLSSPSLPAPSLGMQNGGAKETSGPSLAFGLGANPEATLDTRTPSKPLDASRPGGAAPLAGGGLSLGAAAVSQPPSPPSASSASSPPSGLSNLFDDGGPDPLAAFRVPPPSTKPPAHTPPPPAQQPARPQPPPQPEPSYDEPPASAMSPEATVMFQVPQELINQSAQAGGPSSLPQRPVAPMADDARTVVAQVPQELLSAAAPKDGLSNADEAHYRDVYDKFVETRVQCGEDTSDLTYDRFVAKLLKNRQQIVEKHKAKSVRFQVYVKEGKAALRALPVRE